MRSALGVIVVIGALAVVAAAAQKDQTWKGAISDSKCNGKHTAEHDGKKLTDVECTNVCMKNGAKVRLRVRRQGLPARQSEIENDCESRRPAGRVDRNTRGRHHLCQDHQDAGNQISGLDWHGYAPARRFYTVREGHSAVNRRAGVSRWRSAIGLVEVRGTSPVRPAPAPAFFRTDGTSPSRLSPRPLAAPRY